MRLRVGLSVLLSIVVSTGVFAQVAACTGELGDPCNQICNGGFERGVPDNTSIGFDGFAKCPAMADQWCRTNNTPDLFVRNSPNPTNGIPNNFASVGCPVNTWDYPAFGNNRYAGFLSRGLDGWEGLYTPLSSPLVAGEKYTLSFHTMVTQHGANVTPTTLRLGFTTSVPKANSPLNTVLDFALTPQTVMLCDGTNHWTTIQFSFIAPSTPGLRYFVIEPTLTSVSGRDDYYFVDDFRLVASNPVTIVTKVDKPQPNVGDVVTFSVAACNQGATNETNVVLDATLPPGLTLQSGGNFNFPKHTVAVIPAPFCVNFTYKALVTSAAAAGVPVQSCVTVTAGSVMCPASSSACATVTPKAAGSIAGSKFNDDDGNGVWDTPFEQGLAGWTIELRDSNDVVLTTTLTDASGHYQFNGLAAGTYKIAEAQQTDWVQTSGLANVVSLKAGETRTNVDFGNQHVPHCVFPPPAMRAWWPFDELAGPVAHDIAGGIATNGAHVASPAIVAGRVSRALSFDGVTQHIVVLPTSDLDLGASDLTIDAWVKTKQSGRAPIVDKRSNERIGYALFLDDGRLGIELGDRMGHTPVTPPPCSISNFLTPCTEYVAPAGSKLANDGRWHHVAATVDRDQSSGGALYVDGKVVLTFDPTIRPLSLDNAEELWIAQPRGAGAGDAFHGEIDEVEIFSRALSGAEIASLVDAGVSGKCKDVCGNPSLIQSDYFTKGNFEVVVPDPGGGIAHYWRNNDKPGYPWTKQAVFGVSEGAVAAVSMIQSNFGRNFEVIARIGDKLAYFSRNNIVGQVWSGPQYIASGVAGTPSLIQSNYGTKGDFEVVVPLVSGGVGRFTRKNDLPGTPWVGPDVFAANLVVDDVAMIESDFFDHLEVVMRVGDKLAHVWRDQFHNPPDWSAPTFFATGVSGAPAFLQRRDVLPHPFFDVFAPLETGDVGRWVRVHGPFYVWQYEGGIPVNGQKHSVAAIQSNFDDNFELLTQNCEEVTHFWSSLPFLWNGTGPIEP
ncbi:MAG TPA: LamG-like jellyroll fold domain-containing protein [Thermoanaerobaculia bacterium]|nr:LamG-like jellyroll fold domain-containing protein [Thermoanaerobaculia bacterium]